MATKDLIDNFAKILEKKDSELVTIANLGPFLSRVKSVHTVQGGDSLWSIAQANHVTVSHVLELNPELRSHTDKLKLGQKIKIPYSPMDLATELKGKDLEALIRELASSYEIDPAAFRQALMEESKLDPKAINPKTQATGLGQLMPYIGKMYGVTDLTDAAQNAAVAAAQLKSYLDTAKNLTPDGSSDLVLWHALMMYNWGIGNFMKWYKEGKKVLPPKEARVHPAKVFYGLKKTPPPEYLDYYNEFVRDMSAHG